LIAAFTTGGDFYFPTGNYRIASAGPDTGGVDVTWRASVKVTCDSGARFFTDGVDNDLIRFTVPSNGAGLPLEKLTLEWVGGIIDQRAQKNSTVLPHIETYPPANPGASATTDGISIRASYTSGGLKNAASLVRISGVTFRASDTHWETAGGDSGLYVGEGTDLTIIENCSFTGCRDQGIYGSNDGTGVAGGHNIYRNNSFVNCFFGCAVKRSVPSFEMTGNRFTNCVAALQSLLLVGSGCKDGIIANNYGTGVEVMVRLDSTLTTTVYSNVVNGTGATRANGQKMTVYGVPVGVRMDGGAGNVIQGVNSKSRF
jgi:hypothetical protein